MDSRPREIPRRIFLSASVIAAVTALTSRASSNPGDSTDLESRELDVGGDPDLARRTRIILPRAAKAGERIPVLVLLHGLGETSSERLGMSAWAERYGLVRAYERLLHPPVKRSIPGTSHWTKQRLAVVNAELETRPMGKLIVVCPTTPNVYRLKPVAGALDRYADWIEKKLLPAVRANVPAETDPSFTAIDGCSLGGYIALEVFTRKPALFGGLGVVQAAIGEAQADDLARRLEVIRSGKRRARIHLLTSSWDPYRKAQERLSKNLSKIDIANDLEVLPGGHDQIFLREIGTLTMLLWHDRQFRSSIGRRSAP